MAVSRLEPAALKAGKQFHLKVQRYWTSENDERDLSDRQEKIEHERSLLSWRSGRKGRMDVFVTVDGADFFVSVVEIKNTDWDVLKEQAVRRNVRRQIRQIERCVETIHEEDQVTGEKSPFWIAPGIYFPR